VLLHDARGHAADALHVGDIELDGRDDEVGAAQLGRGVAGAAEVAAAEIDGEASAGELARHRRAETLVDPRDQSHPTLPVHRFRAFGVMSRTATSTCATNSARERARYFHPSAQARSVSASCCGVDFASLHAAATGDSATARVIFFTKTEE